MMHTNNNDVILFSAHPQRYLYGALQFLGILVLFYFMFNDNNYEAKHWAFMSFILIISILLITTKITLNQQQIKLSVLGLTLKQYTKNDLIQSPYLKYYVAEYDQTKTKSSFIIFPTQHQSAQNNRFILDIFSKQQRTQHLLTALEQYWGLDPNQIQTEIFKKQGIDFEALEHKFGKARVILYFVAMIIFFIILFGFAFYI